MNEPFGDAPDETEKMYRLEEQRERRQRVLTLAREMMLAMLSNAEMAQSPYPPIEDVIERAEAWIRSEDAYVLPEDMQ